MTSRSVSSRAKLVRTSTTIATFVSFSNTLLLFPIASPFTPFLPSTSSPSSSHRRSLFHSTEKFTTSLRNNKISSNTNITARSSIETAVIMSPASTIPSNGERASQNIPTFDGSDEKSKATDFANYFCAVRLATSDWISISNSRDHIYIFCVNRLMPILLLSRVTRFSFLLWAHFVSLVCTTLPSKADADGS